MAFEPVIITNGLSQVAVSVASLLLALRLGKEKKSMLKKPFFLLSGAFLVVALINISWSFGAISISEADNMVIGPIFNLIFLGVWFYAGAVISGHRHIYYIIPIFIMSINAFLLFNNLAVISDVITGLVLVGVFFHLGFVDNDIVKKMSFAGMAYGLLLAVTSVISYAAGIVHTNSFWFIPNIAVLYLIYLFWQDSNVHARIHTARKHHIPVIAEVFKIGFFILSISIFIMLGTLGVHELGHSLAAKSLGCSHATSFGIGKAVTHIKCESASGSTFIALAGFILTILISLLIYFMGNDFAKRIAHMMFGFSILIAVDDFTVLSMPYSAITALVIISSIFIGYSIVRIVNNYELEYSNYEASAHAS